ncbi:MAG: tyrosine-protein phosphatase [Acidimicrobiales bacterium]
MAPINTSQPSRCVAFTAAPNFRDLGGYPSDLGGTTRWQRAYRAGSLDRMTAEDRARLDGLGVATIFDLRTGLERDRHPDPLPSVHLPLVGAFDSGPPLPDMAAMTEADHGIAFMRDLNLGLIDHAAPAIGHVITAIAAASPAPLVFHCTAGKDRTGLIAALLLEVLGVDRDTVLDDFTLSEQYAGRAEDSHGFAYMIAMGMAPEAAAGAFGAPRAMMSDVLDALDERHGGAEAYLTGPAQVGAASIDRLRAHWLEG